MRVSKVDVVVLGCLAEAPCHGYELRERMRASGMGLWASVGKASVYQCLQRLERAGLVAGRAQEGTEGPDRRVFRITRAGRARFAEGLEERFADPSPFETEAGVALGFVHLLGPAAGRRALESRERALVELKDAVKAERARGTGLDAMLVRQQELADVELAWLRDLRTSLRQSRP
jgi:DNA-binding PadR family transcriptional regulator